MSDASLHPVRRLGPTAWAVMQALHDHSELVGDACVAEVTIRSLALELGLAKNTVHRALRRLARSGLVYARQARTGAGTFSRGHYVLTPSCVDGDTHPVGARPPSRPAAAVPSAVAAVPSGQLALEI